MIHHDKITPNPRISAILLTKALVLILIFFLPSSSAWGQNPTGKQSAPNQSAPNQSVKFVAHRGASYLAPENTLASVKLAWELGADAAECDVMLSSDNKVVVFHDKNTKKLTGESHDIADTPWETLRKLKIKLRDTNRPEYEGETIPLLKDLLATIPSDRMLVIEIKTGPEILPFLKGIVDRHWNSGRIAFISFNFDAVRQAKAIYPEVPCYYLSAFKNDAKKHIAAAVEHNLDGLNLRHGIIDLELSGACREAGLDLWCWTVNDPDIAQKMRALGVTGLTTDRPQWLKEQLLPESGTAIQGLPLKHEAEYGSLKNMPVITEDGASSGAYLSIQKSSEVNWEIPITESGYYQVEICYRTLGGDKMQYLLKNGEEIACGFDMTADWKLFSQPFYLEAGINSLGIRDGWGSMDIDYIALKAPVSEFGITPHKHTFFKSAPHDLVFKVDNFHQEVQDVKLNDHSLGFSVRPYPHQESAIWLDIEASEFSNTDIGDYQLSVILENKKITAGLSVQPEAGDSDLIIVTPDVEHGSAMLLKLPSGKNMLIDCGKDWVRDSIVAPMLHRNGVDTIQTFILTHYHGDHDGGDSGKTIIHDFHVQEFIDYHTHPTGYEWVQDGVNFKILNSFADGEDENTHSLAIRISYNGFTLVHGGDTYASNQQKILQKYPDDVPADVFYANHHFHGSVDPGYIIATNPDLVILQAQEAIYARAAYRIKYEEEAEKVLNRTRSVPVETLPAIEVGCIVLRIEGEDKWDYECYRKQDGLIIPGGL